MDNSGERVADDSRVDFSALASTVLSVLSDKPDDTAQTLRSAVVRQLVKAALRGGAFNAEMLLNDLADARVTPDQIVDIYIPEAARQLGVMWIDDDIGFAKVTIATARLQGLLTILAPPWSARPADVEEGTNVLFVLQAGDSHTLGPHVATAQLRRMGASVRLLFGPSAETVQRVMAEDAYDLVMFSCSRPAGLAHIARTVKTLRAGFPETPPFALGGLVLDLADRVKDRTGVDLVTGDVRVALRLCDSKWTNARSVTR